MESTLTIAASRTRIPRFVTAANFLMEEEHHRFVQMSCQQSNVWSLTAKVFLCQFLKHAFKIFEAFLKIEAQMLESNENVTSEKELFQLWHWIIF